MIVTCGVKLSDGRGSLTTVAECSGAPEMIMYHILSFLSLGRDVWQL